MSDAQRVMVHAETAVALGCLLLLGACKPERPESAPPKLDQQGVVVPTPAGVRPTPAFPARFKSIGRAATSAEVRAWNIDVNGSGDGLPRGRGTYESGAKIFAAQCAVCHGAKGEGLPPLYPRLVGSQPSDFSFAQDYKLPRTIGNYWPYATTLYDYINRAMPFPKPGSLTPDEVYSVVAYLLAENQVIPKSAVMDRASLPKVAMPGRPHFVPDNRTGGSVFR